MHISLTVMLLSVSQCISIIQFSVRTNFHLTTNSFKKMISGVQPAGEKLGPSFTTKKINEEECSHQENEVKHEHVCLNTEEVIIKVEYEESGSSYVEETNHKIAKCPSCKYEFCIPIENLKNQASLASKETKPSCSNSLSEPLSKVESVFETLEIQKLEKKLELKTALAKKRLFTIKKLQKENKILINKNLRLKHIIECLKKDRFGKSNYRAALGTCSPKNT
ncbi:uncharacterized protein isoform X3 [Choristoneura fumiferana]|uniref:uncharacterized protein isoform X3 n=1 Tax=Choristoneura fumiferana TaxID=7141 RepID=UPI003D159EAC